MCVHFEFYAFKMIYVCSELLYMRSEKFISAQNFLCAFVILRQFPRAPSQLPVAFQHDNIEDDEDDSENRQYKQVSRDITETLAFIHNGF